MYAMRATWRWSITGFSVTRSARPEQAGAQRMPVRHCEVARAVLHSVRADQNDSGCAVQQVALMPRCQWAHLVSAVPAIPPRFRVCGGYSRFAQVALQHEKTRNHCLLALYL